ncbi:MAG: M48 family metallopeptidase [Coriobacteriia bacterium]
MAERDAMPAYTVRRSNRARHVRLTVSNREGLVVTLPPGVSQDAAHRAVAERADWARRHLAKSEGLRALLSAPAESILPHVIELRGFGETWPVEYRETVSGRTVARTLGGCVVVAGATRDAEECLAALRRWRDRTAGERLPLLLEEVSSVTGLTYAGVSVRGQRTRWGSCSGARRISLNRNLVFLPEHLVRYVLVHELAHTRERNHGPGFWGLLDSLVPESAALRRQMRDAGLLVPAWAHD